MSVRLDDAAHFAPGGEPVLLFRNIFEPGPNSHLIGKGGKCGAQDEAA